VGLAAVDDALRDRSNCRVGIVTSGMGDSLACAPVAANETRERGNSLVADFCVAIMGQHSHQIGYDVGNANVFVTASLTGEAVQCTLANRRDWISQGTTKRVGRHIACVVVEQE
jgi:hypothetical protein